MTAEVAGQGDWKRTLWLMVGVRMIMTASFSIASPFLPYFVQQLGEHRPGAITTWTGIIASIAFLGAAIMSPVWGALSDRYGRKIMLVRSSAAGCLGLFVAGLAQNVWQLAALMAFSGFFGGFSAASSALVASRVPNDRLGLALGWLGTAQLVGALIGPLIGGLLADHLHDYRLVYFTAAILAFITVVVCVAFVGGDTIVQPAGERKKREGTRSLFRHPALLSILAIMLLTQAGTMAPQAIIALRVQEFNGTQGWVATAAGFAVTVPGIADVLASPWLGKRSDRIGYVKVLVISLIGAALFTIPQAFAQNYWTFIAMRFGVGIFLGGILPAANALLARLFPVERRGAVLGLAATATFLGQFSGPFAGGIISARGGLPSGFLASGLAFFVAALLCFQLRAVAGAHRQ